MSSSPPPPADAPASAAYTTTEVQPLVQSASPSPPAALDVTSPHGSTGSALSTGTGTHRRTSSSAGNGRHQRAGSRSSLPTSTSSRRPSVRSPPVVPPVMLEIQVSCRNLSSNSSVVALFEAQANRSLAYIGHTEGIRHSHHPDFQTRLTIEHRRGTNQKVKFNVYTLPPAVHSRVEEKMRLGSAYVYLDEIGANCGVDLLIDLVHGYNAEKDKNNAWLKSHLLIRAAVKEEHPEEERLEKARQTALATMTAGRVMTLYDIDHIDPPTEYLFFYRPDAELGALQWLTLEQCGPERTVPPNYHEIDGAEDQIVRLMDILAIYEGHQTTAFVDAERPERTSTAPERCFSVIVAEGSLDLECANRDDRESFMLGIHDILTAQASKEREEESHGQPRYKLLVKCRNLPPEIQEGGLFIALSSRDAKGLPYEVINKTGWLPSSNTPDFPKAMIVPHTSETQSIKLDLFHNSLTMADGVGTAIVVYADLLAHVGQMVMIPLKNLVDSEMDGLLQQYKSVMLIECLELGEEDEEREDDAEAMVKEDSDEESEEYYGARLKKLREKNLLASSAAAASSTSPTAATVASTAAIPVDISLSTADIVLPPLPSPPPVPKVSVAFFNGYMLDKYAFNTRGCSRKMVFAAKDLALELKDDSPSPPPASAVEAAPKQERERKPDRMRLYWCKPGKPVRDLGSSLKFDEITDVLVGKSTATLQRKDAAKADDDCCCSIAWGTRTLDLVADASEVRDAFVQDLLWFLLPRSRSFKAWGSCGTGTNDEAEIEYQRALKEHADAVAAAEAEVRARLAAVQAQAASAAASVTSPPPPNPYAELAGSGEGVNSTAMPDLQAAMTLLAKLHDKGMEKLGMDPNVEFTPSKKAQSHPDIMSSLAALDEIFSELDARFVTGKGFANANNTAGSASNGTGGSGGGGFGTGVGGGSGIGDGTGGGFGGSGTGAGDGFGGFGDGTGTGAGTGGGGIGSGGSTGSSGGGTSDGVGTSGGGGGGGHGRGRGGKGTGGGRGDGVGSGSESEGEGTGGGGGGHRRGRGGNGTGGGRGDGVGSGSDEEGDGTGGGGGGSHRRDASESKKASELKSPKSVTSPKSLSELKDADLPLSPTTAAKKEAAAKLAKKDDEDDDAAMEAMKKKLAAAKAAQTPASPPPAPDVAIVTGSGVPMAPSLDFVVGNAPPPPPMAPGFGPPAPVARKLKQLHWDPLTAPDVSNTIFYGLQASPEGAEEDHEDLDILFANQIAKNKLEAAKKDAGAKGVSLIDSKRAYNVEIGTSRLKMTVPEIRVAIMRLDPMVLTEDKAQILLDRVPTLEELTTLKKYTGATEALGSVEQFFMMMATIPMCGLRLECHLFRLRFPDMANELKAKLKVLFSACKALTTSTHLTQVYQLVLQVGNYLNAGTRKGNAAGFKLASLPALSNTKSTDGKLTLLDYIVSRVDTQFKTEPERAAKTPFLEDIHVLKDAVNYDWPAVQEEHHRMKHQLKKIQTIVASPSTAEDSDDHFHTEMTSFYAVASEEFKWLTKRLKKIAELEDQLLAFFGETKDKTNLTALFSMLSQFTSAFEFSERNMKKSLLNPKKPADDARPGLSKRKSLVNGPHAHPHKTGLNEGGVVDPRLTGNFASMLQMQGGKLRGKNAKPQLAGQYAGRVTQGGATIQPGQSTTSAARIEIGLGMKTDAGEIMSPRRMKPVAPAPFVAPPEFVSSNDSSIPMAPPPETTLF